jgi:hypothetical protein
VMKTLKIPKQHNQSSYCQATNISKTHYYK